MKITWVRQVKPQKKNDKEKAEAVAAKKAAASTTEIALSGSIKEEKEEEKFVFTVVPETVVLNPKMGIMVEFRANST